MKHIKNIVGAIVLSALFVSFNAQADQTGDCTAGEEFCEQNSLTTTNATTTNNTNTNENGINKRVLIIVYCAAFTFPTTTGSIGIPASV